MVNFTTREHSKKWDDKVLVLIVTLCLLNLVIVKLVLLSLDAIMAHIRQNWSKKIIQWRETTQPNLGHFGRGQQLHKFC